MDFDCFTGNRSSIPTHSDSFGKWINLRPGQPKLCEECWVVSSRCWQDINLNSAYDCENGLLSLLQFNHMEKFSYSFQMNEKKFTAVVVYLWILSFLQVKSFSLQHPVEEYSLEYYWHQPEEISLEILVAIDTFLEIYMDLLHFHPLDLNKNKFY